MVLKFGQTAANTLANGKTIKLTAKEFCITQMATSMRASGSTIRLMAMAHTRTPMEPNTLDNGKMISKMDSVLSSGLMVKDMKGSTGTEPKLAKGF